MTNISSGIRHTVYSKLIRLKEMIVLWMVMLEIAQDCSTKRVRLKKKCGKGGKRLLKTQIERLQHTSNKKFKRKKGWLKITQRGTEDISELKKFTSLHKEHEEQ